MESLSIGEFENWVLNHSTASSQVIAIRASLRVIPLLNSLFLEKNISKDIDALLIGTFRACFVSDIYVQNQTAILYREASDAVSSSYVVTNTFPPTMRDHEMLLESPSVAGIAARASHAAISSNKTFMARTIDSIHVSIPSDQLLKDLKWADKNQKTVNRLLSKKLWFQKKSTPNKEWEILKINLLNLGYRWKFWIDWYQSKLDGTLHPGLTKAQQDDLYYNIATFSNKLWDKGAEVVNRRITELLEERETSKYDFYLSYSRDDEDIAIKVKKVIEQEGYTLSPEVEEYPTSSYVIPETHIALDMSSKCICLYSNSYWTNAFKLKEWNAANTFIYRKNNFIIPFLIKDSTIPVYAEEISFANLIDLNEQEFKEAILKAIKKDPKLPEIDNEKTDPLNIEIFPQNEGALQFKTNEDGVIELDLEVGENQLLTDQNAIDRHSEVTYLANELVSSYDPNSSSANAARPIVTIVQRYIEALGDTPEEANINFVIPRGEVLRQELEREEKRDEFTSSPPLPDNFKSSLTSLVKAHNIYVLLDPVLDKRDQASLGPDAKENLVSKVDGLKIVEDAFSEGLIKEEIVEAINDEAETVQETPNPDRRQDRRFSESIKNLSRILLSNAQSIAKKIKEKQGDIIEVAVAGAGGATVATGGAIVVSSASWAVLGSIVGTTYTCFKALQWIIKNEEWIIQRFENKKEIKAFIEALKKLPLK